MRRGFDRRAVVAIVLIAVAAGAAAVGGVPVLDAGDDPTGEAVLADARQRYADADSVVGTATVTVRHANGSANATVEFAAEGNRSRVVVRHDNATYRAGTNGTVAWYAGPNRTRAWTVDALRERARTYNRSAADPGTVLNRTRNATDAELLREGSDDGTTAYVVRVTPTNDSRDWRATLWIATGDSRLLRATVTDGSNTTIVDYRDQRFGVEIHDSTFAPPGDRLNLTTVRRYGTFAAAQQNTSLDLPHPDWTFDEAAVFERAAGRAAVQRYRAGGDNVTVVSTTVDREFDRGDNATNATVGGHAATVVAVRNATVVYWRTDGVTTAVIVTAGRERALELARVVAAAADAPSPEKD